MKNNALWAWTAIDLAQAIAHRVISSREAVQASLDRIAAVNPRLNAIVDPMGGEALAAAEQRVLESAAE